VRSGTQSSASKLPAVWKTCGFPEFLQSVHQIQDQGDTEPAFEQNLQGSLAIGERHKSLIRSGSRRCISLGHLLYDSDLALEQTGPHPFHLNGKLKRRDCRAGYLTRARLRSGVALHRGYGPRAARCGSRFQARRSAGRENAYWLDAISVGADPRRECVTVFPQTYTAHFGHISLRHGPSPNRPAWPTLNPPTKRCRVSPWRPKIGACIILLRLGQCQHVMVTRHASTANERTSLPGGSGIGYCGRR
jgi:hypothetical protein